ncbi:MAG TPA: flagellar protein export ATPase FliI [Campylobacterales bacterium]|nr:flagellar protein export ATPase FliI [Campylobacterales bacterium]
MTLSEVRERLKQDIQEAIFAKVIGIDASTVEIVGLNPSLGDIIRIEASNGEEKLSMVISVKQESFRVSPFGFVEGIKIGDRAYVQSSNLRIPVGEALLGRVVDPLMKPIDDAGPIYTTTYASIMQEPIDAMKRGLIDEKFKVGVKSIDGLLTTGIGQKVGIFAGSGVGKSTLMGMIVRGSQSPIKVVALIGERGREVPEFIEKNLGGDLTDTVVVVATSDDSSLMRKYGAFSAMSVAEYFKSQGRDVLFIMDSVTRFAMAQREIGLALGEPPTSKGYPPSSLTLLAQLMERAGKEEGKGSITAFFTVLIEGDDMSDPIADQSRSILDGHIVLSREMTDLGVYPPINILNSASRVMNDVVDDTHLQNAMKFKRMFSLLKENEVLIRIGAYEKGSDPELDEAINKKQIMEDFLKQSPIDVVEYDNTIENLADVCR